MSSDASILSSTLTGPKQLSADGNHPSAVSQVPRIETDEDENDQSVAELLFSAAATSYYLSLGLHLLVYGICAVVFTWLGNHLLETDQQLTPIRASLDEFDRNGDQPKFEATADINMAPAKSESTIQQLSNNLRVVENGTQDTRPEDLLPSFASTESDGADDGSAEFMFKIPESGFAVTKGSFTVWSEPEVPRPGRAYKLIVQVRLPSKIKSYRINDLVGKVVGTDSYVQKIPYDRDAPDNLFYTDETLRAVKIRSGSETIKVRDNKIQLMIVVPPPDPRLRLVKDTIQIRSRRLRESQELELVFGGRERRRDDN